MKTIKIKGLRVRSRCEWYKKGGRSTKFFLTLEKIHASQTQIKTIAVKDEVAKEQTDIL